MRRSRSNSNSYQDGGAASSHSRSCGSSCSCQSHSSDDDDASSGSASTCSSHSGSIYEHNSSDETSDYQCSIATSKYFTKKQLVKLKRIITNFLLLRQRSKLQIHFNKWLKLMGRSTKIRSKKLVPEWRKPQKQMASFQNFYKQQSSESLSTEDLASLVPTSIDLFDPKAHPIGLNSNNNRGCSSNRSRRSNTK